MDLISKYKDVLEAVLIFIVMLLVITMLIPTYREDPTKGQLIDLDTKQVVYKPTLNESYVIAVFIAFTLSIFWLIMKMKTKDLGRRRSIVEVWEDIPLFEKVKLGLPTTIDKQFIQDNTLIPVDETYSLLRFPNPINGTYKYLLLDMLEDWKKRSSTPVYSFYEGNMGLQFARNMLGRKTTPISRALTLIQQLGFTAEEARLKMLEKIKEEESKKANLSDRGDVYE